MNVKIIGRKVNLRENFKTMAQKKLSRFEKIFSENSEAKILVTVERNNQTVEITIFDNGMIYRAEDSQYEMNDALDCALSKLGRQIRKNKCRLDKKIHCAALDKYAQDYLNTSQPEQQDFNIVRSKKFYVQPMTVQQAVLQMNMLEHTFFIFRDIESDQIKVVYLRNDGDYGLLEPEK